MHHGNVNSHCGNQHSVNNACSTDHQGSPSVQLRELREIRSSLQSSFFSIQILFGNKTESEPWSQYCPSIRITSVSFHPYHIVYQHKPLYIQYFLQSQFDTVICDEVYTVICITTSYKNHKSSHGDTWAVYLQSKSSETDTGHETANVLIHGLHLKEGESCRNCVIYIGIPLTVMFPIAVPSLCPHSARRSSWQQVGV